MNNLCDQCKKNKAIIFVNNTISYCPDCYNDLMLKQYGIENTLYYTKTIRFTDNTGMKHNFSIYPLILAEKVYWHANDKNSDYSIRMISEMEDNGKKAFEKFKRKIKNQVNTKTFTEQSINRKGTIYINEKGFVIDGEVYTAEELHKIMTTYAGFSFKYQIESDTADFLEKDQYLVPTTMTADSLKNELLEITRILEHKKLFIRLLEELINKLKVFHDMDRESAKELRVYFLDTIQRLITVGNDDLNVYLKQIDDIYYFYDKEDGEQ